MAVLTPPRRSALLIALAVLALDQLSKWIVTEPLSLATIRQIYILPFFSLTWMQNYGVSWGLFVAQSAGQRWALTSFIALVATLVAVWMWRETNRIDRTALAIVLGGALGNIIDRVRVGYVVDFADLHFGEYRPFLIFNLADSAITIGVLLLVARALLVREKGSGQQGGAGTNADADADA